MIIALPYDGFDLEELVSLAVGVFATILLVISLMSYRKTRLRKLLLVSAAFGLFATKTFLHHLNIFVFNWGVQTEDLVFNILDAVILVLFFLAITIKNR